MSVCAFLFSRCVCVCVCSSLFCVSLVLFSFVPLRPTVPLFCFCPFRFSASESLGGEEKKNIIRRSVGVRSQGAEGKGREEKERRDLGHDHKDTRRESPVRA